MEEAEPGWMQDPEAVLELNGAIERLGAIDAQALSVVELRHFGGFTIPEIARILEIPEKSVSAVWQHARLWLYLELAKPID